MSSVANVTIHASQFPDKVQWDLLHSLRAREVNHKFHYDSVKQTQKWLALHQAYSPSRNDDNCVATYDRSFEAVAARIQSPRVHLIGLGCGGGHKDTRLLSLLKQSGKRIAYTPCDVSVAMVLVARQTALSMICENDCHPLVCDLLAADDLAAVLEQRIDFAETRLITFFGMIPNFEPQPILSRLGAVLRPDDLLLFSANLAPGPDYATGVHRILPQYNNALTRDWLMTFLLDLGVERDDGELDFIVEADPAGGDLMRIAAYFHFLRARQVQVAEEVFTFHPAETIRLFFSYRYTPERIRTLLGGCGLNVLDAWITTTGEEGVFLCQRNEHRSV